MSADYDTWFQGEFIDLSCLQNDWITYTRGKTAPDGTEHNTVQRDRSHEEKELVKYSSYSNWRPENFHCCDKYRHNKL